MSKKNNEYWKKRFELLEQSQHDKGLQCYANVEYQYKQAQKQLEGQIAAWYQRLAKNNKITLADARKLLTNKELAEFKWDVNEYIRYGQENAINGTWVKQLENASAKYHISRLEALQLNLQHTMEVMFGNQLDTIDAAMRSIYSSGYYHSAFEIQKGIGVGWDFAKLDDRKISKVINKPWGADGKNFSTRIWGNRQKLVNEINKIIPQNIILGQDPQKAIDLLAKKMNVSKNNAGALVMTEEAFFSSAAQNDCFKELGVEKYAIVATLDSHTSDICRSMDGKGRSENEPFFYMHEYEIGVTAPPFHVWCRTTTIPYFDDEFTQGEMRAARNEDTGKTYYVPADMTYPEWKKEYVDNADQKVESKVSEYLIRNHTSGQNTTRERLIINEAVSILPQKVQTAINAGTIIDVGKNGASQYDYNHDILYIAEGAQREEVIHEIGHLVENKMLQEEKVAALRKQIVGMVSPLDIKSDVYYDGAGNPKEVYFLLRDEFVSEYQGRIYIDDIFDAFEPDGTFKDNLLWEFMSEPFREYAEFPNDFKQKHEKFYDILQEVFE